MKNKYQIIDANTKEVLAETNKHDVALFISSHLSSDLQPTEIVKRFPFSEGDTYFTVCTERDEVIESVWDDVSEELYDEKHKYYASKSEAEDMLMFIRQANDRSIRKK